MFKFYEFFNHIFNKENIDDGKLRSKVIYNTRHNLIILISYASKNFYSAIEFIAAIKNTKLKLIISNSSKERQLTEEELEEFDKKTVSLIDNRYYILLSGTPEEYANMVNYMDLNNEIFELLVDDFYHHCSSTIFNEYINYGIFDRSKFIYKDVVPSNYNKLVNFSSNELPKGRTYFRDDLKYILDRLPDSFLTIDIAQCINYYQSFDLGKHYEYLFNVNELVKTVIDNKSPNVDFCNDIVKASNIVFKLIVPDPCVETLEILNAPIFLRENLEDVYSAAVPIEELDEIFQQDYDRFTQITAGESEYEDIDEQIGDDEETENMRKEDIIN